jgi:hypothetical protein
MQDPLRLNRLRRLQACAHYVLHARRVHILLEARDLALAQLEHMTELGVDALAGGLVAPAVAALDDYGLARVIELPGGDRE